MGLQTTSAHHAIWKLGAIVEENIASSGMLICENMNPEKFQKQAGFHQRLIKASGNGYMSLELRGKCSHDGRKTDQEP